MWHDFFSHVMLLAQVQTSYDTDGIVNITILLVRSRWLKQGATQPLAVHDTDGIINTTVALLVHDV